VSLDAMHQPKTKTRPGWISRLASSLFRRWPKAQSAAMNDDEEEEEQEEFFLPRLAVGLSHIMGPVWESRRTFDNLMGPIVDPSKDLLLLECQHTAAHIDHMRCHTLETLKIAYNWIEASNCSERVHVIEQHEKSLQEELVVIAEKLNGGLKALEAAQLGLSIFEARSFFL